MNIDKYYSDIISEIQYAGIYEQWCVLDRNKVVAKQKNMILIFYMNTWTFKLA